MALATRCGCLVGILALTSSAPTAVQADSLGWVDLSGYVVGAQSQGGLTSASGLQVDLGFSNLDNFNTVEFPSPFPTQATLDDPSWPFDELDVSALSIVPSLLGAGPPISTQLTFEFTNPGGLAAGGSIAVMDLEFGPENTVAFAGFSGGAPVPVNWSFASYAVAGEDVDPPLWDPASQTLRGPGDFTNPTGFPNNFALLTTDRQLDRVVLTLVLNEGVAFAVGQVPEPGTLPLLFAGFVALAAQRRRVRRPPR